MIVPEPVGGAHRDPAAVIAATGDAIAAALGELRALNRETLAPPAPREIPGDRPQPELSGAATVSA